MRTNDITPPTPETVTPAAAPGEPAAGRRHGDPDTPSARVSSGSSTTTPHAAPDLGREAREREGAWRRAEQRQRARSDGRDLTGEYAVRRAAPALAEHAFVALADNVRDYAIFLMDPDGTITFWGEGARLMKWWTKDEAEGGHLRLLYPDGGSEDGTAEEHLQQAADRGEYTGEGQRVRSDCSTFWAGVTLTALRDDRGALLGFAKVTRDLTARRAADAMLQAASEAAEEARAAAVAANLAKSGFVTTMSHEIRTPINAILGYHDLLAMEVAGPLTPRQREFLARAGASGRHLLTLVDEVLDFSKIEAGRVPVTRDAFRLGNAVGAALRLVEPQARARELELVDAAGSRASATAAWGDEMRVRQILTNLLSNAVKFTQPGGRVTVSAGTATRASPDADLHGDGPWAYVRVEDTGPGIPADQLSATFEPFVQADMALTRQHGGTGLGLAISRHLARLMGGDITARSEVDVGSAFFLWLPAAPIESIESGALEGTIERGAEPEGTASTRTGEIDEASRDEALGSRTAADADAPAVGTLRDVADALLAELERVLHSYVARLRSDPAVRSAHRLSDEQLEDHLATFLADVAKSLAVVDVGGGLPTPAVRDGTSIQRFVAERHGAQRARLGWTEEEVRREFAILGEELAAAVRRRAPRGPTPEARLGEAERALEPLRQFLRTAEGVSVATLRASAPERGTQPGD